ncbi:MAG: permease-like cell division protein FtsX [Saprospiraceae bacterium]
MKKAPGTKPNYFYTLVSVTLVLLLLGLFGLLVLLGQQLINALKEQVEIIVELKEDTPPSGIDSLKMLLAESDYVKENSARFVSREDGAAMMQEEFGEDFMKLDMANPLYDIILFNVRSDWMTDDSLAQIRERIRQLDMVSDVYYQESVAGAIANNLKKASVFVLVAGIFFIIVAVALILNTIRLALYANRFVIKNMELVGASWGFISKPYLLKSIRHGFLCGFFAIAILATLIYVLFYNSANELQGVLFWPGIAAIFGSLLVLGILIEFGSTYYVVNKYLRMRVDDLY